VSGLIWSQTILDEARRACRRVEADLSRAGVPGRVLVTGPACTPGVLTRGDIDLQLRISPQLFERAVRDIRAIYPPASLHSWAPTLAVFDVPADRPTGLAVTPVGSPHDIRFTIAWDRLRREPGLLREYNALKTEHYGSPAYEERKSAFFSRIAPG
jgi:GrpB-like predicted nucleotidyltransferase (UPF0157 family)